MKNNLDFKSAQMECQDCDFFEEGFLDNEILSARQRARYHAKKKGHKVRFLITYHYKFSLED